MCFSGGLRPPAPPCFLDEFGRDFRMSLSEFRRILVLLGMISVIFWKRQNFKMPKFERFNTWKFEKCSFSSFCAFGRKLGILGNCCSGVFGHLVTCITPNQCFSMEISKIKLCRYQLFSVDWTCCCELYHTIRFSFDFLLSGWPDSNWRHSAWEADVLPLNYTRIQ